MTFTCRLTLLRVVIQGQSRQVASTTSFLKEKHVFTTTCQLPTSITMHTKRSKHASEAYAHVDAIYNTHEESRT